MKDMDRALRVFMKAGAYWPVFCSTLQRALRYKAIASKKERASTNKDSVEGEFDRKESKHVWLQWAY